MCLAHAGSLICMTWESLPSRFPTIELDAFMVMPDHVHAILWLAGLGDGDRTGRASPAPTLGTIVGAFKSLSAKAINATTPRSGALWQRNYYEHIIRDERDLHDSRFYVLNNVDTWNPDGRRD
jgi:REP element-mobilizing transposase RayT